MFILCLFFVAFTGVDFVYSQIILSSNATNYVGEVCPEIVQFTCVANDFETTLIWGFNSLSSTTFPYAFNRMDRFPLNLVDGNVTIVIVNAIQNQENADLANFTSTLTVSLSYLINFNVQRVLCGATLENANYDLSLSDVAIRAPPPRPVFSCLIADDAKSVIFNWNSSFNSVYNVNHYCIEFATCSACNISTTASYVCNGLQIGQENMIIFGAVNCDIQEGATENVTVDLRGTTQSPRNVEVVSFFNSSVLTQVTVKWSVNGDNYSDKCDHKQTTYIVTVQNTVNASIEQEVDVDSCENSMCSTDIPIPEPEGNYSVSVRAVTIVGTNSTTFPSVIPANSTSLLRLILNFTNCITYATCASDIVENGKCDIRYSSISDSESVTAMLHSPIALPFMIPNTKYDFVTSLMINSSFSTDVQTIFVTGKFDPKLTGANVGLIIVGSIITLIAIACEFGGAVVIAKTQFCKYLCIHEDKHRPLTDSSNGLKEVLSSQDDSSVDPPRKSHSMLSNRWEKIIILSLYGLSLVPVAVTIVLWISFAGVLGQQRNTCETSWQMSRDNLAISSLIIAALSLAASIGFLIFILTGQGKKVSAELQSLMLSRTQKEHEAKRQSSAGVVDEQESAVDKSSRTSSNQICDDQQGSALPNESHKQNKLPAEPVGKQENDEGDEVNTHVTTVQVEPKNFVKRACTAIANEAGDLWKDMTGKDKEQASSGNGSEQTPEGKQPEDLASSLPSDSQGGVSPDPEETNGAESIPWNSEEGVNSDKSPAEKLRDTEPETPGAGSEPDNDGGEESEHKPNPIQEPTPDVKSDNESNGALLYGATFMY